MYTGPGYLSAFLGVANMVLLVFLFREIKVTRRYGVMGETKLRKMVAGEMYPKDIFWCFQIMLCCFSMWLSGYLGRA